MEISTRSGVWKRTWQGADDLQWQSYDAIQCRIPEYCVQVQRYDLPGQAVIDDSLILPDRTQIQQQPSFPDVAGQVLSKPQYGGDNHQESQRQQ